MLEMHNPRPPEPLDTRGDECPQTRPIAQAPQAPGDRRRADGGDLPEQETDDIGQVRGWAFWV